MEPISRNNAKPVEFYGRTLDECVNALLKFKSRGESVVLNFNGHNLYSCDVTMDSAYQEILGKTKSEFDKERAEWREKYKREEKEKEEQAKAKVSGWIKKGSAMIYPERLEEWEKCVEARASDLYHGAELDAALELMEKLDSGATFDEVKAVLDGQDHSGASYGMVRSIILSFSKRGPEFLEHTADGEISPETQRVIEEKKRENAQLEMSHSAQEQIDVEEDPYAEKKANATELQKYVYDIDNCVKVLTQCRERGENVYVNFNGHKIYACDVTLDSAYMEVTGRTKDEHEKAMAEWREKYEREEKENEEQAKAKVPGWIKKGSAMIYPERLEEWEKCVEARASDLYHGAELDAALELMEKLDSGATFDEVKTVLDDQDHSGASYGMVRSIILSFSKRGPEFFEHTADGEISPETHRVIEEKKRENQQFDQSHKIDSTKEVSEERRREEAEIASSITEKEHLVSEIASIQQQLEALKAKEAELESNLNDKVSKYNQLDEK